LGNTSSKLIASIGFASDLSRRSSSAYITIIKMFFQHMAPPNKRMQRRPLIEFHIIPSMLRRGPADAQRWASLLLWQSICARIIVMKTATDIQVISRSSEVMSGAPVFVGTRVPVQTIIDYLAGGHPLEDFLDDFPTVTRQQALELLSRLKEMLKDAQI
jgi:uncharacterized protein (DUF433 family)